MSRPRDRSVRSSFASRLALVLGGALCASLAGCGAQVSETPVASAETGWIPELSPWRDGEREALPVSFRRGDVGLTLLLDLQPDGTYQQAVNGCLGRMGEGRGTWAFTGAGFALEGEVPIPGGRDSHWMEAEDPRCGGSARREWMTPIRARRTLNGEIG